MIGAIEGTSSHPINLFDSTGVAKSDSASSDAIGTFGSTAGANLTGSVWTAQTDPMSLLVLHQDLVPLDSVTATTGSTDRLHRKVDTDGGGSISEGQFTTGASDLDARSESTTSRSMFGLEDFFDAIDEDGDGLISRAELVSFAVAAVEDFFNAIDGNGDGLISRAELTSFASRLLGNAPHASASFAANRFDTAEKPSTRTGKAGTDAAIDSTSDLLGGSVSFTVLTFETADKYLRAGQLSQTSAGSFYATG
jgi:Ca2+-binding EF-hand superfamily protein